MHHPFFLRLWSLIGHAAMPWLHRHARRRLATGREETARLPERFGQPGLPRPAPGTLLLWVHAASVGESRCVLPVITRLLAERPKLTILMTTATLTGGQIVAAHPAMRTGRLLHQLCPYDAPHLLARFLEWWQPCGLVLVESELWPGMLGLCRVRQVPVMLLNARLSARSAARWQRAAPLLRRLLRDCRFIMPRSTEDAARLSRFGLAPLLPPADLKENSPALPFDQGEADRLRERLGGRPIFVAVSTHPGEEELVIAAAREARLTRPDLLTIIIPRHPERGAALAARHQIPRRATGALPGPADPLWLADTLGETGLFFHLAERVLVGHSLCPPGGGHNPLEPLRFRRPTATGPYMQNWQDIITRHARSLQRVHNGEELARWLVTPASPPPEPAGTTHASQMAVRHLLNVIPPGATRA